MAIAAATVVEAIAIRRKQLFILLMVGAVCLGTSQSVQAQCTAKNEAFQSGEHVMYDLYFNWKFIWKKVGLASLTTNATTYHSEPAFRFNLLCVGSKKTDFFFKMLVMSAIGWSRSTSVKRQRREAAIRWTRLGSPTRTYWRM